jgi:hypothetical protein
MGRYCATMGHCNDDVYYCCYGWLLCEADADDEAILGGVEGKKL